jgi:hypothetical protein
MNCRHLRQQLLWQLCVEFICFCVPPESFSEQPININAKLRFFRWFVIMDDKINVHGIYREIVSSCEILQRACDECWREEESREPEDDRGTIVISLVKENQAS